MPSIDLSAIGTPTDTALCRLFGYQYTAGQEPQEFVRVVLTLQNLPQVSENAVLDADPILADTDVTGLWYVDLPQGQTFLLTIWKAGINNSPIVIPTATQCNVTSLL